MVSESVIRVLLGWQEPAGQIAPDGERVIAFIKHQNGSTSGR
jgi:hypothetical protein